MPDSVLHTLPRTGEGRFSSHYRLSPQTHPDVLLMHPDSPIPHLHQWGTSGRYPMPFLALNGAVLPASIKMIGESFFKSLSAFASDWPAVLSHPALLYPHSPIRTGNRSTGCGITFQSHCHSPCAGLSPAIPMMGNRDAHQKGGSSADIPHRNLAPLAHGHKPRLPRPTCQAGIEDQRGTEAQKTPCGATPNKSAGAANDLNSFVGSWHRDAHGMVIQG